MAANFPITPAQIWQLRTFFRLRDLLSAAREESMHLDTLLQSDDERGERLRELFETALHRGCKREEVC